MADFGFNVAKGKVAYYASLPAANDALVAMLLLSSGIETDATLKDLDTVTALVAGTTNEATDASYSRQTLTNVTATVDDTNDRVNVDCDDITFSALAGGAIAKLVIYYDPNTTASDDSNNIPIAAYDFAVTPDGSDVVGSVSDFARCT